MKKESIYIYHSHLGTVVYRIFIHHHGTQKKIYPATTPEYFSLRIFAIPRSEFYWVQKLIMIYWYDLLNNTLLYVNTDCVFACELVDSSNSKVWLLIFQWIINVSIEGVCVEITCRVIVICGVTAILCKGWVIVNNKFVMLLQRVSSIIQLWFHQVSL